MTEQRSLNAIKHDFDRSAALSQKRREMEARRAERRLRMLAVLLFACAVVLLGAAVTGAVMLLA